LLGVDRRRTSGDQYRWRRHRAGRQVLHASFVDVKGNVRVGRDATLIAAAYTEPSEISGDIEAKHCKSVLLQRNVTVGALPEMYPSSVVCPLRATRRIWLIRQNINASLRDRRIWTNCTIGTNRSLQPICGGFGASMKVITSKRRGSAQADPTTTVDIARCRRPLWSPYRSCG
jgi:hypothetical protein